MSLISNVFNTVIDGVDFLVNKLEFLAADYSFMSELPPYPSVLVVLAITIVYLVLLWFVPRKPYKALISIYGGIINFAGYLAILAMVAMAVGVFKNVVDRTFYSDPSVPLDELTKYFCSYMFLLGFSYALWHDSHVRVDIVYEKLSTKVKCMINIFGGLFFALPFCVLITIYSGEHFSYINYEETNGDPGSLLKWPWIIAMPISFGLLLFTVIATTSRYLYVLKYESDVMPTAEKPLPPEVAPTPTPLSVASTTADDVSTGAVSLNKQGDQT